MEDREGLLEQRDASLAHQLVVDVIADADWDNVLSAIDVINSPPKDKPLCIYLPLSYPHPPYGVEEPFFSAIDRKKLPPRVPAPEKLPA